MKIVIMIPARLGSKRIKKKNLRYLGNKPLFQYILETAKSVSDDVYLNASEDIFEEIAKKFEIQFYRRPKELSSDSATNDDFVFDFLTHIDCDWIIQANITSPFITKQDFEKFINEIKSKDKSLDAIYSVKEEQIECVFNDKPINFDPKKAMQPSQSLTPVKIFCNGLMAWKKESFINNYKQKGNALFAGKIGYITLTGNSTIDIDNEYDFRVAEGILEREKKTYINHYYNPFEEISKEVPDILKKDGVEEFEEISDSKIKVFHINNYRSNKSNSYAKRLINSDSNSVTFICQNKNEGNRKHFHRDWDEWWYITNGQWKLIAYDMEYHLKSGDLIYIPKGVTHQIISESDGAVRLAVSRGDVLHIFRD